MYCRKCKSELVDNSKFCNNCGEKIEENNTNQISKTKHRQTSILIIIFFLALIFAIISGLVYGKKLQHERYEEEIQKEIAAFYLNAKTFSYSVLSNSVDIESVGNDISSYWYDYIYKQKYKNPNDAIEKALKKNEEKLNQVEEKDKNIKQLYSKLLVFPSSCVHCEEIKSTSSEVYNSYNKFYNAVLYASGTYADFSSSFSSSDTELATKNGELRIKLEAYNE